MTPPRVVTCESLPVKEKEPPGEERTAMHKWCSKKNQAVCERNSPAVYIYKIAEEKIRNHSLSGLKASHEVMGLMVGGVFEWGGKQYTLVRDVVTTELESDMLGVRFDEDGFSELIDSLDNLSFDYRIVGWYHSHPGFGCFLSHIDHNTQRGIFNQPHHSALVIDPQLQELELYGGMERISFRIYWDKNQDPYS